MADGISRIPVPGTYRYVEIDAQRRIVIRLERDEAENLALLYGQDDRASEELNEAVETWDALYGPGPE